MSLPIYNRKKEPYYCIQYSCDDKYVNNISEIMPYAMCCFNFNAVTKKLEAKWQDEILEIVPGQWIVVTVTDGVPTNIKIYDNDYFQAHFELSE